MLSFLWFLGTGSSLAAPYPAEGKPIEWVQPDGTRIRLRVFGDEFYARTSTEDGRTVIFNAGDLTYYHARRGPDGKSLVASEAAVGGAVPADIPPGLAEPAEVIAAIRDANRKILAPEAERKWAERVDAARNRRLRNVQPSGGEMPVPPFTGVVTCLAIPAQFPDDPATAGSDAVNFPVSHSKVIRYCNEIGYSDDGNAGSIRDYFHDQSNGLATVVHEVAPIVTLPSPRNYYNYSDYPTNSVIRNSGQAGRMVVADSIAVLQAANFDFSSLTQSPGNRVLATSVLFAGPTSGVWAAGLWPHKFVMDPEINVGTVTEPIFISNYQITDAETPTLYIGTYLHELSHLAFDFPDFYDYGGESSGLGVHCLMGGGNWLDDGRTPAPLDLYLKSVAGWANITDLVPGEVHLASLATTGNQGRRIAKPGSPTEYFLVENRGSGDKWATYLPDHGIAVWHVDEAIYGNDSEQMTPSQHYQVSLEQADGEFDLENGSNGGDFSDLFDNADAFFNDGTLPDARWWSGTSSGIAMEVLSAPATTMNVRFSGEIPLAPALDAPSLAWTTDAAHPWAGQIAVTHDGIDAAISGNAGDGQSSWLETIVNGPGTIVFWWKVSSESGGDFLRFRVDGAEIPAVSGISGSVDWEHKTAAIPPGSHTLRWAYEKNSALFADGDAGWLDEVAFYPGIAADVLVTTLADESNGSLNPALGTGTSLREAILHGPDPSVVAFVPDLAGGTVTLASGQLAVTKNLTLEAGSLSGGITVSGNDNTRVFDILAGKTVVMNRFRIVDGEVSGDGGGVRNAGTLTLNDCEVMSNEATDDGAGIFSSGPLILNSTSLTSNSSGSSGGALAAEDTLSLNGCTISGNTSTTNGGGIYSNNGTVALMDCTLSANHAGGTPGGGAIDNDNGGTMTLTRCTLSGNTSGTKAGAIENDGALSLLACTLHGNAAATNGGAIEHVAGVLTLTSCTMSGNSGDVGGAIDGDGTSTIRLYSCTVSGNHATDKGGGIEETTGTLLLENSIVAGNTAVNSGPDLKISAINTQGGVNLISSTDGLGGSFSGIVASPNLAALGNYGGPTLTMFPLAGSPVIDAGGDTALTVDQRGLPRVAGAAVDIGSVEVQPGGVVTSVANSGPGSLRDTVAAVPAGGTVSFAPILEGQTIELSGGRIILDKNLTLDASALDHLTISASGTSQILEVTGGDTVRLIHLQISDGEGLNGGGIYNEGDLTLENCVLSDNGGNSGGAIYNAESGVIELIGCDLLVNTSLVGGAIYNEGELTMSGCTLSENYSEDEAGAVFNAGSFTATESAITSNTANFFGGGISSTGLLSMTRCTVDGNFAADSGGGIAGGGAFTSCTLSGNTSYGDGGAVVQGSGPLTLVNCTLADNYAIYFGGGIESNGTAVVMSCTIHGNIASWEGGGIALGEDAQLTLVNSIVAGNQASDLGPDIRGPIENELGVNLVGTTAGIDGGFSGITGLPGLMPLGNYGGPTRTMLPLPGSPAIDAGGATVLAADQRDLPRVAGAAVDIGAVEIQPPLVVTTASDSGPGSLRDAMATAPDGTTISFDVSLDGATINVFSGGENGEDNPLVLDKNLIIDASDRKGLTLVPSGHTSLVAVSPNTSAAMVHLQFHNGWGGAIHNQGQLLLRDCSFSGNSSEEGGAIFNAEDSELKLTGCRLSANTATTGGALHNEGNLTLESTLISGNEADSQGGGIFSSGSLTMHGSIFTRNGSSQFGGAIYSSGELSMIRCTVERNESADSGAGLVVSGNATVDSCTISGNICGGSGGGIIHGSGTLDLILCTIQGNKALADYGGGVFSGGTISVHACTIAGNQAASEGGGLYIGITGQLALRNSIAAGNTAFDLGPDLRGSIATQAGVSLLGSVAGVDGSFTGIVGDPMLQPLGLHGGPTLTMPPLPGSPAINAGGLTFLSVDQRGYARIVGGTVDIGAVETGNAIPVVVVNTTADEDDGIGTGYISLRDAISGADAGSIVSFAPALNGNAITLTLDQLVVDKNLMIDASSLAAGLTITGDVVRAFSVPLGRHVRMAGLTVSSIAPPSDSLDDGTAIFNEGDLIVSACTFAANTGDEGGAIHNAFTGELAMTECTIFDNEAQDDGGGLFNSGEATLTACKVSSNGTLSSGAGIFNSGSLSLATCLISSNSANVGGGGVYNIGPMAIDRCTFSGNVSEGGFGGGIVNSVNADLTATNCTVSGNAAWDDGDGAGIFNAGPLSLNSCTIAANGVGESGLGGGIFNAPAGELSLVNSIVAGNSPSSSSPDINGSIAELVGVNLVRSTAGITITFSGLVADPMLAPLGDYGGLVPVMPPLPGSPVIEAAAILPLSTAIDQLGNPRPAGPFPDIGAVEAVPFSTLGLDDADQDGIPDLVEPSLGLTVGTNDAGSDGDGDGSSDADEIGNMTDPFDPAAYLRIAAFSKTLGFDPVTNPEFTISFPTFPGLTYGVEADEDLDFSGGGYEILVPAFMATGYTANFEITLPPGRGFARARRY